MGKVYESTQGSYAPKIRFTSQDEVFPKGTWFIGTKMKEEKGKEFKKEKIVDGQVVVELVSNKIFTFIIHDTSEGLRIHKRVNKEWQPFPLEADCTTELN